MAPAQLGDLKLKNRCVLAALTRGRSGPTRVPNEANQLYYEQRAGFGLVMSEATAVSHRANGWGGAPGIYTAEMAAGWKAVTDRVHAAGSLMVCQLWYVGRQSHSSFMPNGEQIVSASDIPCAGDGVYTATGEKVPYEVPRPLTVQEIADTVEEYGVAAQFAKDAGFDGVEVHSANGYLMDQFLQSCSNNRTDEYGGGVEGRARFLREVLERVLKVWPAGRVGIKLSPNGAYGGMGSADNTETFTYVLKMLDPYRLAYAQVVDGLSFGFHEKCPQMTLEDVRKVYSGPVMGNCGYTADSAEAAIAANHADCVSFGRPSLSNPDFVERVHNGWALAPDAPLSDWFVMDEAHATDPHLGYTTYPAHAS
uniref:NADH:flavin oxidoreductase/NADH oxidase N-terminal domain-containing protein n=1 Tax=Eutreptiella gymnastica TaxID=73025 RepID=A0A7S1N2U6_9EUGL